MMEATMNGSSMATKGRWSAARRLFAAGLLAGSVLIGAGSTEGTEPLSGVEVKGFSTTIKPGDDFYLYVNGPWLDKTEIPGDRSDYGTFSILDDQTQDQIKQIVERVAETTFSVGSPAQQVGDFYSSVMDLERRNKLGLTPIDPIIRDIQSLREAKDIGPLLAKLRRQAIGSPLAFGVEADAKNSSEHIIYFMQAGISLPDRDYYLKDEPQFKEAIAALTSYVTDLLKVAGESDAATKAEAVVGFESKLAKLQWSNVENRDPIKTYNRVTGDELKALYSNIPFDRFLQYASVSSMNAAVIGQPSFAKGLNDLLASEPVETWRAYLLFHAIDTYAPFLTDKLESRHFRFHEAAIRGVAEQKVVWKRAVDATEAALGMPLGQLYVEKHFQPEAKKRMVQLVENLKTAFGERIDNLDWMSDATKKAAHEKLAAFTTKIGYPDKWKDYSSVVIHRADLVGNIQRVSEFEYQYNIGKLGKAIDRTEWGMTPQTINAYYNPLMNEIVFPAAILQPPFFNLQADDAVNYGAIGAVIGHEISHGFDDQGSQYDGQGNLRMWWTQEDQAAFKKRTEQLVAQYNAYKPVPDMAIQGDFTLGENIGDLGGLSTSYSAYKLSLAGKEPATIDGLSGDQRFFLGWSQSWRRKYRDKELRRRLLSDPHSPSQYRVIGIVSNMDAFYAAFGIKEGEKMYIPADKRVRIW
jgi:putative endopeptidase